MEISAKITNSFDKLLALKLDEVKSVLEFFKKDIPDFGGYKVDKVGSFISLRVIVNSEVLRYNDLEIFGYIKRAFKCDNFSIIRLIDCFSFEFGISL